ncbi:MAG: septum formation initiator family protein [Treponema sp.]|nr:septum formation initiator family protein [Treponema sp.]
MSRCRLLISVLAGTLFYVLISFVGGRDGLWATSYMQEQKRLLSANASTIQQTNNKLSLEKVALQKDMEVVGCYAKRLGYVYEGEKIVKISGLTPQENQIYDAGTVLRHTESDFIPEKTCKGIGIIVFLCFYAILMLFDYARGALKLGAKKMRLAGSDGMTMYDMR